MIEKDYAEAVLLKLVSTWSGPGANMRGILDVATAEMSALGLEPAVNEDLLAVSAHNGHGGVLLNGHLDTVPVGQAWTRTLGDREGTELYGRGTADMKAGCAAMLAAARELKRKDVPFSLLFTTDEETTMAAAIKLHGTGLVRKAAAIVVGEPSDLKIIGSEKGILWFEVTTHGRSAHGSMPHLGENAILQMSKVLAAFEPYTRPTNYLEEITVNIGSIDGGSKPNVVADLCSADLDVRYPPHLSKEEVLRMVESTTRAAGVPTDIVIKHEVPAARVNENSDHIRRMKEIAGPEVRAVSYGTEMAFYAQSNPRCLVLGPGKPEMCHVPDERVDVTQVPRAAEIYARYAEALAPR
ncbi:MAG TPA: M20/M25/M40 family metallo-hydrolase [Thermoplasmata archaeon]|nr:M20/M25/M40 family metallo-hydrolase [Thermoplasmata archaeon]